MSMTRSEGSGEAASRAFSLSAFASGLLASFVGFAGSFAVVVQGLRAVGASPEEAASGLMAVSVSMGVCAIILSFRTGMPISVAWSTPGAAFLATLTVPEGGFPVAVGAFVVTAMLVILSGLWKQLGRAISAIPVPLASAMLAGVILPLCIAPFEAIVQFPVLGLAVFLTWVVMSRINRLLAVPVAVFVAVLLIALGPDFESVRGVALWSRPTFVTPRRARERS